MPEVTDRYAPGTPCWVDLMAKNQQGALDLYRDLFAWQGEVGPPEIGGYAVCTLNGKAVAGISPAMAMDEQPPPPTVWTTYLASDDVEATQQAITENGGTVIAPVMEIPDNTGRMLVAADPTGAVFGVWQALDFVGAQVVNEPGALTWNEVYSTDLELAGAFYHSVFGLTPTPMEGAAHYHSLNLAGRPVGGLTKLGEHFPPGTPSHWRAYFAVDDTDSTVDALVKAGGDVLEPPVDTPYGRTAVVRDPQGAVFAVIRAAG